MRSGFSLIELMVVVAVMSGLSVVGIASYNKFNDRQIVTQAAENFALKLRTVLKQANSGEKKGTCNSVIERYNVNYDTTTPNSYTVNLYCNPNTLKSSETVSLRSGVTFAANVNLDFLPMGGGLTANTTINVKYGSCIQEVDVGTGGTIALGALTGC